MVLSTNILGLLYFLAGSGFILLLILICNKLYFCIKIRKMRKNKALLESVNIE